MGNAALCGPSNNNNAAIIKVFSDTSPMIYTKGGVKAAEIMVHNPAHFLCQPCHLRVGQRIRGMCGDDELEPGGLYVLLPVHMLFSVLTDQEEMHFFSQFKAGLKRGTTTSATLNLSKIFPQFCLFPNGAEDDRGESRGRRIQVDDHMIFSRQRSWQPALETIVETPPRPMATNLYSD